MQTAHAYALEDGASERQQVEDGGGRFIVIIQWVRVHKMHEPRPPPSYHHSYLRRCPAGRSRPGLDTLLHNLMYTDKTH